MPLVPTTLQNIDYISDTLKVKADIDTDDSLSDEDEPAARPAEDEVYGSQEEEDEDGEPPKPK